MYTKHFWMILGYPQTLGNFHWFKKANVPHILQATLVGTKLPLRVVQLWSQDPEKNTRRWRGETALHRWVRWCEMRDDADCIESQWRFHDLRIILIFKAKVWPVGGWNPTAICTTTSSCTGAYDNVAAFVWSKSQWQGTVTGSKFTEIIGNLGILGRIETVILNGKHLAKGFTIHHRFTICQNEGCLRISPSTNPRHFGNIGVGQDHVNYPGRHTKIAGYSWYSCMFIQPKYGILMDKVW